MTAAAALMGGGFPNVDDSTDRLCECYSDRGWGSKIP